MWSLFVHHAKSVAVICHPEQSEGSSDRGKPWRFLAALGMTILRERCITCVTVSGARVGVFALALVSSFVALAEPYDLPNPAPMPSLQPTVPPGEKMFYEVWRAQIPGCRTWAMGVSGDMWVYGTSQSVGDGAGMYVYVPAAGKIAPLCSYDTGCNLGADAKGNRVITAGPEYKGLSLWFKGDGSDAKAVITTDYAGSKSRFPIPMKDTNWHKVFIPWQNWCTNAAFWFLTYSMERTDTNRANWYIVDRIHYYQEEKVEAITPTPDRDPPGLISAKAFVSGRENISRTLGKLKEKKPVKIVIAGDSIPCGAQLWYVGNDAVNRIYWRMLAQRLKEFYGYADVAIVTRAPNAKKVWEDTPTNRPAADLTVVGVVFGGAQAAAGLENMDQLLAEKPDLVIWEYGANDATFGKKEKFLEATGAAVEQLKAAGVEVVLQTITPSPGILPVAWMANKSSVLRVAELNEVERGMAREQKLALADVERAFTCRGIVFVGSLYADNVHPNHLGHEMIADVLDALLTDRDVKIWRHGPAADVSIRAK